MTKQVTRLAVIPGAVLAIALRGTKLSAGHLSSAFLNSSCKLAFQLLW